MRTIRFLILFILTVLSAGCVPKQSVSLYPLFDDKTLTVEPALVGSWSAEEGETWTFQKSEDKKYRLIIASVSTDPAEEKPKPETIELDAHLVQLAGTLFLDLYSRDAGPTGAPAHIFATIRIEQNSLHIGWIDEDWLRTQLELEAYMSHLVISGDGIVLTAPTRDLQFFFSRHAWELTVSDNHTLRPQPDFHRVP